MRPLHLDADQRRADVCGDHRTSGGLARRSFFGVAARSLRRRGPFQAPQPVVDGLDIYPRSAWAGDNHPPLGELLDEEVKFLLVHHSAGSNTYDEAHVVDELQGIYRFHTGPERGWPDVCYNFFIDRFGRVFEGRADSLDRAVMADATGGSQGFAQLVCLLGDFTDEMPSDPAITSLQRTLAWLAQRHDLDVGADSTTSFTSRGSNRWPAGDEVMTNTIAGHRDMSQTACPGDAFYPYVDGDLRTAVLAVRDTLATATTSPAPTTSAPTPVTTTPVPNSEAASASAVVQPATSVPADSAGSSPDDLIVGAVAGTGLVAVGAGLAWVIRRRRELGGR